nr:ABC transporter permease [Actinomycetales bacterium]
MTATSPTAPARVPATASRNARFRAAFRAHLVNEARLLVREPAVLIFGAIMPLAAIIVMSLIPGAREPLADFGGLSVVQAYVPTIALFATSVLGLTVIPAILGSYRETGVLRRLRTTPASPATLLAALFVLVGLAGIVVAALIVLISVMFGVPLPQGLGWFVVAVLLSLLAFLALGTVLAAVVPNPRAAAGIGNVVAALMWFFAGLWYPRALFPDWLATIANLTPGGAAATAMTDATLGSAVAPSLVIVLLGWTVLGGLVAVRTFRWE